jgi:hypothetical protein
VEIVPVKGEALPADRGGSAPTLMGDRETEQHGGADPEHSPYDLGGDMRFLAQIHSWLRWTVKRSQREAGMEAEVRASADNDPTD